MSLRATRRLRPFLIPALIGLATAPALAFDAVPTASGAVLAGTRWSTDYFVVDGVSAGPTVMIVGGVHGDEIAGARAASDIRCWSIARGRLVILPRVNVPALGKGSRLAPDTTHSDLNRNFPRHAGDAPRGALARALWAAVEATKPDVLLDLHEGFDFHKQNRRSVGSSVLFYPSRANEERARRLTSAVNAGITERKKRFSLLRPPVTGSLARSAYERLGVVSMILETTKTQPLHVRVGQHHLMVAQLLHDLGMLRHKAPAGELLSPDDVPLGCAERHELAKAGSGTGAAPVDATPPEDPTAQTGQ